MGFGGFGASIAGYGEGLGRGGARGRPDLALEESLLRGIARRSNVRRLMRQAHVFEDFLNHRTFHDRGNDFHLAAAVAAGFHIDREDAPKQFGPGDATLFPGRLDFSTIVCASVLVDRDFRLFRNDE